MTIETVTHVPINERYGLTVKQAIEYFGIGEPKIKRIIADNLDSGLVIQNGNKILIKRKKFEKFLDDTNSI